MARRHELLIEVFAREFPGVDDLLVYTYDQDAWLCSEFGPCPRCLGVPLHERLVPFLDCLAAKWRSLSPQGRLWWEPWELSAGQVLACAERVKPQGFGLALHCNIAEVMGTLPVDRWLKNTAAIARQRDIPVIVEYWLGGPSEELETLLPPGPSAGHLARPQDHRGFARRGWHQGILRSEPDGRGPEPAHDRVVLQQPRHLRRRTRSRRWPNLMGRPRRGMIEFWRLTSQGMELFPWDTSWYIREVGRSRTDHSLSAAMLRGQQAHTPSWYSTRHAIFMKTDNSQPDPWMLEDVQLRCQLAADRWEAALDHGGRLQDSVPASLAADFKSNLADLAGLRRRALAYALHLRETNLAMVLRKAAELKLPRSQKSVDELLAALKADLENHQAEMAAPLPGQKVRPWPEMEQAIALLQQSPDEFLQKFLKEDPDKNSKGIFSVTSR